jgi:hypothetical protein
MLRLMAVAFALTLASSAQPLPPYHPYQSNALVVPIRQACGAGMHYVNGVCLRKEAHVPPAAAAVQAGHYPSMSS